jgi:site-specific recombinase XerC
MASVFKPQGGAKYVILYTDESGRRRKKTGATDKTVTLRIARDLENRVALRREGLIDPAAESYLAHESRPLSDHLVDFRRALDAKGGTGKHSRVTEHRAGRVLNLAKAKRISDLSLSKALDALAALRAEGLSTETINHHVRAVKAFSRWLWRDGRVRDHALAHLATSNPESDRRHKRRALTPGEAARLVEAAENGPTVMGMSGPDRAMLYRVALGTGFRVAELSSLTPASFRLALDLPVIVCEAGYTKNGRQAEQPVSEALANILGPWMADRDLDRAVFSVPDRPADMIRTDLQGAGIDRETASGVIDFHALRATYVSHLVSSGASVKTCQVLARHSTPSLTIGIYAKASVHDLAGAVESLPDLTPHRGQPEALAATGTDPRPYATGFATAIVADVMQPEGMQTFGFDSREDLKSSVSIIRRKGPKFAGPRGEPFRGLRSFGLFHVE